MPHHVRRFDQRFLRSVLPSMTVSSVGDEKSSSAIAPAHLICAAMVPELHDSATPRA
jgi:hypothetical protein